jgi:hypothetical protein
LKPITPHFKVEEVYIGNCGREKYYIAIDKVYSTRSEAQAALKLLLNL